MCLCICCGVVFLSRFTSLISGRQSLSMFVVSRFVFVPAPFINRFVSVEEEKKEEGWGEKKEIQKCTVAFAVWVFLCTVLDPACQVLFYFFCFVYGPVCGV